MTLKVNC